MKGTVVSSSPDGSVIIGEDNKKYLAKGVELTMSASVTFDPGENDTALNVKTFDSGKSTSEPQKGHCSSSAPVVNDPQPVCTFKPVTQEELTQAVLNSIFWAEKECYRKSLWYCVEYKAEHRVEAKFWGENGWAPEELFGKIQSQMGFKMVIGKSATKALDAFFAGTEKRPTICECHSMLVAVYYKAIQEVIGADLFDQCFPDLSISSVLGFSETPISKLFVGVDYVGAGDWAVFNNHYNFRKRHPSDTTAQGWNIICMAPRGEPTWLGFGLGGDPLDTSALRQKMFEYYVAEPSTADLQQMDTLDKKSPLGRKFSVDERKEVWAEFDKCEIKLATQNLPYIIGIPPKKTKRLSARKVNEYIARKLGCKLVTQ
jgi:hypothetical protein